MALTSYLKRRFVHGVRFFGRVWHFVRPEVKEWGGLFVEELAFLGRFVWRYLRMIVRPASQYLLRAVEKTFTARTQRVVRVLHSKQFNIFGKIVYTPFAAFGQRGVAVILLIAIILSNYALFDGRASAATYTFSQSSWAGGVSGSTLVHPTNQSGWTSYESKSSSLTAGSSLSITPNPSQWAMKYSAAIFVSPLYFDANGDGWVGGSSGNIFRTDDAGTTWSPERESIITSNVRGITLGASTAWAFSTNLYRTTDAGETWATMSTSYPGAAYRPFFIDANTGWSGSATLGAIRKTTDGGTTWVDQNSGTTTPSFLNFFFVDANTGWAVGTNSAILKTTDGGTTWSSQVTVDGLSNTFYGVYFLDANTGWVSGVNRRIYKTTDGGTTWVKLADTSASSGDRHEIIQFFDSNNGYAFSYASSYFYKTTNGGSSWTAVSTPAGTLYGFFAHDFANIWAVGSTGVAHSSDSGVTWTNLLRQTGLTTNSSIGDIYGSTQCTEASSGRVRCSTDNWATYIQSGSAGTSGSWIEDIDMLSSSVGFAVGSGGRIFTTSNSGSSWALQTSGTAVTLNAANFIDTSTGWVVGLSGTILKTTNGGSSWSSQTSGTTTHLYSVHFDDANNGLAGGYVNRAILRTTDGGTTWSAAQSGSGNTIVAVYLDGSSGKAIGSGGEVYSSSNGGATWSQIASIGDTIYSAVFASATTGWAGSRLGKIYKTIDGGATWSNLSASDPVLSEFPSIEIEDLSLVSSDNIWAYSSDYGLVFNYSTTYPTSNQTLVGNAYDAGDPTNIIGGISWTEDSSLPSGTGVTVSIRTAATEGALSGESWTDLTNASANCSKVSGVVTCTAAALPAGMTSSGDNQYFQYKVTLTSDGSGTPTVSNVTVTYVVNAAPDFESTATATQNSDGTVSISYSVRDVDTDTGTYTSGYVTPYFQYSLDNGSTWTAIASSSLQAADITQKAVATSTYTTYSATWDVVEQFTGSYDTDAKIKVIMNDREPANNIASSTSAAFVLDVKDPELGALPILIDASQATPLLTLDATDDTALEMKVGIMPDLSDGVYESFTASRALSLDNGDTVYAQFRDAKGNETAIISQDPLSPPGNTFYQDTSNPGTSEWREFFAWGVVDEPAAGFAQYNVYRSVDGGAYALHTTVANRLVNYIVDSDLNTGSSYAYKVSFSDDDGNVSFFSPETDDDYPDGIGGSDLAAPTISSVTSSNVNTTGATVTWTTNKLADSTVYYVATTTYPGSDKTLYDDSTGVPSMVESHSVVLSGLTPATQYYFLVESTDASDNARESASAAFTFTTDDGPVISNVTTAEVFDTEARISWNTNVPADSTVYYSLNSDMSDPVVVSGSASLTTNHSVTIDGLTEGTRYYYYVKSIDGESNEATDKNVISGTVFYHSLNTSSDGAAPTISSVTAALTGETGATITWTTDEPTTSQIEWGDSTSLGTYTVETSVYTRQHAVVLNGLSTSTTYYYRVISRDKSENETADDNNGASYTFTTLNPTTVTIRSGGGGSSGKDRSKPTISSVFVKALSGTSAAVSYQTSEPANERVDYGETAEYGKEVSTTDIYQLSHVQYLNNLSEGTTYHYRITATDVAGNAGMTQDLTFIAGQDAETEDVPIAEGGDNSLAEILAAATESQLAAAAASLSANAAPLIFGVDVTAKAGADSATIEWVTDKPASSLVSYATAADYRAKKAYTITVGFPDERVTNHRVVIENLEPSTTYHFQATSKGFLGTVAQSNDGTFTTTSLVPDISDVRLIEATGDSATIQWQTGLPSRSVIEITNTSTGDTYTVKDESYVEDHTYTIENLDDAATYAVRLTAYDTAGTASDPVTLPLSTSYTPGAPIITDLKISTSIIPDRIETTQTIVSWKTNKVANSLVRFAEGSTKEFTDATELDPALTRDHVVITTALKPGAIYTLVAESGSGGDIARSEPYTIITPAPRASVVDLIFENLDTTFGFLKGER